MQVIESIAPLLVCFSECFTKPGFGHFQRQVSFHMALMGLPHCVTEMMRLTGIHRVLHWTTSYLFTREGKWSCKEVGGVLLRAIFQKLKMNQLILAVDDTVVKKWGKGFFGLGYYPDATDKNPGASRRKVLGHCWVVVSLLWEKSRGKWFSFPLGALLFVPQALCGGDWEFKTKIELAEMLLKRFDWPLEQIVFVVDNLYAKKTLMKVELENVALTLVSRLRSNAALYERPRMRKKRQRGRPAKRGEKVTPKQLYGRWSKRQELRPNIYGKVVPIQAYVGIHIPSVRYGADPLLVIIFPQRSGKKMNVFFSTDIDMDPTRLLEIYGGRFKIEDNFDELKNFGGFSDCRQRSFTALKRHAMLCIVAYSLLRLASLIIKGADRIEAEPWWQPEGPPSVTRLRRAVRKAFAISPNTQFDCILPQNESNSISA